MNICYCIYVLIIYDETHTSINGNVTCKYIRCGRVLWFLQTQVISSLLSYVKCMTGGGGGCIS